MKLCTLSGVYVVVSIFQNQCRQLQAKQGPAPSEVLPLQQNLTPFLPFWRFPNPMLSDMAER